MTCFRWHKIYRQKTRFFECFLKVEKLACAPPLQETSCVRPWFPLMYMLLNWAWSPLLIFVGRKTGLCPHPRKNPVYAPYVRRCRLKQPLSCFLNGHWDGEEYCMYVHVNIKRIEKYSPTNTEHIIVHPWPRSEDMHERIQYIYMQTWI